MENASEIASSQTQATSNQEENAREILLASLSSAKQSYKDLNLIRQTNYPVHGVKDFSVGFKFTTFHFYNKDLIFMANKDYLEKSLKTEDILSKNIRKDVLKFSAAANDLFYMSSSGELHVVFNNSDSNSNEFVEGVLKTSLENPLNEFYISYPHALLQFNDGSIVCFDMTNLTPEDLNSPARLRIIEGLEKETIISFCAGVTSAYFLTNNGRVFECNFNTLQNNKYKVTLFEHFNNKTIRRLWCGKGTFFALEQNEKLPIDNWTQKEILEWVQQNKEFNEFLNIIRSENVTGKDFLNADRTFLEDRLGMEKEDLQTKLFNEIEKVSKRTYSSPRLYAWGTSNCGQLGLNNVQNNVSSPTEVKAFPGFEKNDFIEHVECGGKATVIVTNAGKVWITELLNKDNKAGRWLDLTPNCQLMKDGTQNKAIKVSLNKDHLAILVANVGQKKTAKIEEVDQESTSIKLKGADHICNRLLWDKSLNKDEFIVGYEDRFLGILEIPFNDFCLKTDIPTHRIKFFKTKGEIVWDRATKKNSIGL